MKATRIFSAVFLSLMLAFLVFVTPSYAQEVTAADVALEATNEDANVPADSTEDNVGGEIDEVVPAPEVNEEELPENEATDNEAPEEVTTNLFNRIFEFIDANFLSVITTGGFGATLFAIVYVIVTGRKNGQSVLHALSSVFKGTQAVTDSQGSVVAATNNMLAGYDKVCESNEELRSELEGLKKSLEERDGVISALSAEVLTVLEILATMCANNKNVPQGFKDVVSLKYARCVSLIEDNEKVGSFFAAIKKAIESGEDSKEA
jgi:hypothetical protein